MIQIVTAGLRSQSLEGLHPNVCSVLRISGFTQTRPIRSSGAISDDFSDQSCVPMLKLTNAMDGTWDLRLQAWMPAVRTISATSKMCND